MSKEIEALLEQPLSVSQQRQAVHYAVLFLRKEVADLEKSIESEKNATLKTILTSRQQELKSDLETFEILNENFG